MFTKSFRLFRVFGIPIGIDLSWFIILILVTWSLADGLFPYTYKELSMSTYWIMGLVGALGLFVSIILHELGHAVVAQHYGLNIRGITLFVFGGVAEMQDEPPSARAEFFVAIGGPLVSIALSGVAFVGMSIGQILQLPTAITGVLWYLALINIILVAFNMVPAFPLDGGRVLRAAIWKWKGSLRRATYITSKIGGGFGLVLIMLGVFNFLGGAFISGVWWFVLGLFLRGAAQMSFQQLLVRRVLEGEPIRRFMTEDVQTVPPTATIRDLLENYIYHYHHKLFPVQQNGHLLGCVTSRHVKSVPAEQWDQHTVNEIVEPCSVENVVSADDDAMEVLLQMNRSGNSRVMVLDNDRLVGIVSLKDLMKFLALKLEIEEDISLEPGRKTLSS